MPDRTDATGESGGPDTRRSGVDASSHLLEADFEYASERRARAVAESIGVEVGEMPDERSGATVDREGCVVSVAVEAADLVALRAGTNTWVRLVGVAEDVTAACQRRADRGGDDGHGGNDGGAGTEGGRTDATRRDGRNADRLSE